MMVGKIIFLLLVGLSVVRCQQCTKSDVEEPKEAESLESVASVGDSYPEKDVNDTVKQNDTLKIALVEATADLKSDSLSLLSAFKWSNNVCNYSLEVYKMPITTTYGGQFCWVLKPWWGMHWVYAKGCSGSCNIYPPCPGLPVYRCRRANWINHPYYLFCPGFPWKIIRRNLWLPKCCDCMRYDCTWNWAAATDVTSKG